MSDMIDRDAAMKLRDTLAAIIGAAPMSSIHSALSEYRKALRALPAVEVGIKPLEWDDFDGKGAKAQAWGSCSYLISNWDDGRFELEESYPGYGTSVDGIARFYPSIEAAKAAAQADYAARIRSALTVTPAPALTVWYGSMPESNGKSNWTASLHRKGGDAHLDGFCFARSEYPDRVRYEADRVRWIIGELAEKPDILAYDPDLHSGYIYPPAPDAGKVQALVDALTFADETFRDLGWHSKWEVTTAALAAMKEG